MNYILTFSVKKEFPSPLGDEVLKPRKESGKDGSQLYVCFRPLSGMRCLNREGVATLYKVTTKKFPSPLGDEVLKP